MPASCSIARCSNPASRPGEYGADPTDGLELRRARITNAVRCVPPQNKPETAEIATCGRFLAAELAASPSVRAILALGAIAHNAVLARQGPETGALQIRARRDARAAGRHAAGRQLSLLAAEHEYRHADPGDVRGGVRRPRRAAAIYPRPIRAVRRCRRTRNPRPKPGSVAAHSRQATGRSARPQAKIAALASSAQPRSTSSQARVDALCSFSCAPPDQFRGCLNWLRLPPIPSKVAAAAITGSASFRLSTCQMAEFASSHTSAAGIPGPDKGDRHGVTVRGDRMTVRYSDYAPQDPRCCPSLHKVATFRLVNRAIIPGR